MIKGIDVSGWQGDIDWDSVFRAGFRFAYVKTSEGTRKSSSFSEFAPNAVAAGLKVGAYHFLRTARWVRGKGWTRDQAYARVQAHVFLEQISRWPLSLPPVVDLEWHKGDRGFGVARRTAFATAFIEEVEQHIQGRMVVYTGRGYSRWKLNVGGSILGERKLWLAAPKRWSEIVWDRVSALLGRGKPQVPRGWNDWWIWQASHRGRVNGVESKRVDMDIYRGTVGELLGSPSEVA